MIAGGLHLHAPLRVHTLAESPQHEERLALALNLARLRSGVVWMDAAAPGDDVLTVAHGGRSWLETQSAGLALDDAPGDIVSEIWRATQAHPHRLIGSSRAADCAHRDDLERPIADELACALAERVRSSARPGLEVVQLPVHPGGAPFGIALSHDVDYLSTTPRYRATRAFYLAEALRRPNRAGAIRHFLRQAATIGPWTHLADLALEREHGATSEWFVFARTAANWHGLNARAYNPEYDVARVGALCRAVAEAGSVVGLHASPQAGADPSLLAAERDALATVAGPIAGVRHHMGRFRWPDALDGWREAGFAYDSSFIINDAQGYRLGTAAPVLLVEGGRSLLELSPSWLDTVAYNYRAEQPLTLRQELEAIVEQAAVRGSVEGVVWHGIPLRGDGAAGDVYGTFLRKAASLGGLVAPPRAFAEHARDVLAARLVPNGEGALLEAADTLRRDASVVGAVPVEVA